MPSIVRILLLADDDENCGRCQQGHLLKIRPGLVFILTIGRKGQLLVSDSRAQTSTTRACMNNMHAHAIMSNVFAILNAKSSTLKQYLGLPDLISKNLSVCTALNKWSIHIHHTRWMRRRTLSKSKGLTYSIPPMVYSCLDWCWGRVRRFRSQDTMASHLFGCFIFTSWFDWQFCNPVLAASSQIDKTRSQSSCLFCPDDYYLGCFYLNGGINSDRCQCNDNDNALTHLALTMWFWKPCQ